MGVKIHSSIVGVTSLQDNRLVRGEAGETATFTRGEWACVHWPGRIGRSFFSKSWSISILVLSSGQR
ncbi:hypothetical protein RISK_001790 [Rhodopirellula islandica]|uniref:Uncharacterized protein n=1 Tax=Rhodopirellula islandica TaxID=595434 RepID=A0A0J1EKA6_RHOIS|nr:hypothetical protein RISK_001790 [Rhodopirellula islandica]